MNASFNIDTTIKDMLAAAKGEIKKGWKEVQSTAESFMQRRKKRMGLLATDRISGRITDAELLSFLDDEKLLFKSELDALEVIAEAIAQRAANAALDILYAAINKAIPGIKK